MGKGGIHCCHDVAAGVDATSVLSPGYFIVDRVYMGYMPIFLYL